MDRRSKIATAVGGGALVVAGFGAGAAMAVMGSASAANDAAPGSYDADRDRGGHRDERLLTGATARKVRAAALSTYPDARVLRVETDSDGVYEAHIVTAGGDHVLVEIDKEFTVTGARTGPGRASGGECDVPGEGRPGGRPEDLPGQQGRGDFRGGYAS